MVAFMYLELLGCFGNFLVLDGLKNTVFVQDAAHL